MYKSIYLSPNELECWLCISFRVDQAGVICTQDGIFRINCMDCLDRTNVVQAAIARVVMEKQVCKTIVLWLYNTVQCYTESHTYPSVLYQWFSWTMLLFTCSYFVAVLVEETGGDAPGTAASPQMLQDLPDDVGQQWRHYQPPVRWHSSFKGNSQGWLDVSHQVYVDCLCVYLTPMLYMQII